MTALNNKTAMGRTAGRTGVLKVRAARLVRPDVTKKFRKLRTGTVTDVGKELGWQSSCVG